MKRIKTNKITANSEFNTGDTVFYKVTLDKLHDSFSESSPDHNLWLEYAIRIYGFDAIKVDDIWGSKVVDDVLYLCSTNGQPIYVDGVPVDPEKALESFDVSELSDYIEDADTDIVREIITDYEFDLKDVDELALEMLKMGESFIVIGQDANEIYLFDN